MNPFFPKPKDMPRKRRPKNHSRRNKTRDRNRMIRELDAACRQRVFERDQATCQRCGSKDMPQWSHIFTREYRIIRWDDDNSVVHCRDCHCWFTYHHALGYDWFFKRFPDRWERLVRVMQSGNTQVKDSDIRSWWLELQGRSDDGGAVAEERQLGV